MESTICDLLLAFLIRSNPWTPTVVCRAAWALAKMLIIAVGLSRLYFGVHYPSDVLAPSWLESGGSPSAVQPDGSSSHAAGSSMPAWRRTERVSCLDRHPS